jgi:hypothetical protein
MPDLDAWGVAVVTPTNALWRVARRGREFVFSEIPPDIARERRIGNRFDIPGWGVLYAATEPGGAFAEVLQDFRPTATAVAAAADDTGHMRPGSVPTDWRTRRTLVEFDVVDALPFVDVEQPDTHRALTRELAAELVAVGVERLDVSLIRGDDRLVTRLVASWAYFALDPDTGNPRYSGIRYVSKLGDFECWAVLRGTTIVPRRAHDIDRDDDRLQSVAATFGLTIY